MSLCTIGTRSVITVQVDTPVLEIARMMRDRSLGSVVVLREDKPVGIVTDRDLACRVLAEGKSPEEHKAEDIMSAPLTCVADTDPPLRAATLMREGTVRRLPILGRQGNLVGIICLDDLMSHLSRTQNEMCEAIASFPVPHHGG